MSTVKRTQIRAHVKCDVLLRQKKISWWSVVLAFTSFGSLQKKAWERPCLAKSTPHFRPHFYYTIFALFIQWIPTIIFIQTRTNTCLKFRHSVGIQTVATQR
jgi:hypothetical protein